MWNMLGSPARILVVDDDWAILQVVALKLRFAGLEVTCAMDGDEALVALRQQPFDLVITDLQMPRMSGIELAQAMAATPTLARIPVLLLTAQDHQLREDFAQGVNIAAFISKPFSPRVLLSEVLALLEQSCERQEQGADDAPGDAGRLAKDSKEREAA